MNNKERKILYKCSNPECSFEQFLKVDAVILCPDGPNNMKEVRMGDKCFMCNKGTIMGDNHDKEESGNAFENNKQKTISNEIMSSVDLKKISDKELKEIIKNNVLANGYDNEEWQTHYVEERIFNDLRKEEIEIVEKEKNNYLYSVILALCFYFFAQIVFGVAGLLIFVIALWPINHYFSNRKVRNIIIVLAISALLSPFVAYILAPSDNINPLLAIIIFLVITAFFYIVKYIYKKLKLKK